MLCHSKLNELEKKIRLCLYEEGHLTTFPCFRVGILINFFVLGARECVFSIRKCQFSSKIYNYIQHSTQSNKLKPNNYSKEMYKAACPANL